MDRSAAESDVEVSPAALSAQRDLMYQMQRLVSGTRCRHRALSEHFGQVYAPPGDPDEGCAACDVCLSELDEIPDSTDRARKILSCVARLRGSRDDAYGAAYLADVLRGSNQAKLLERGHQSLSTYGLLREVEKDQLISHIDQLVDLGALSRDTGSYPVLRLTASAVPILRNERPVRFLRARAAEALASSDRKRKRVDASGSDASPLTPDEQRLFETLRVLRREIASGLGVPPYVVFGDAPLQEMCRVRPGSPEAMLNVKGVGPSKLEQFGERFLSALATRAAELGLALNPRRGRY